MNTLNGYSKSTLTDKYVLTAAGGHRYIYDSEFIIGTQTAATGSWTGVSIDSELYDGKQISYWLPFNGSGNATLNLTLAGGTTTGAVNCYYGGTSRLTTHYGAGNIIRLVYRKNVNIGGTTYTGWWADANYVDGNTYTSAWCGTSAGTAAKTASCSNFTLKANSYLHILVRYSNTAASAITLNVNSLGAKPIYINGKASSSSNYTLPAGTYLVFYDGTNFYFRTDKVLPGTIETATLATKSEVARYIECPDTRSTTIDPTTLDATKGVMFDFKQKSVTGLAAAYSGIMTFRPYSNSTDWSGGPAHLVAFDVNGLHHRTASSATWGSWSDIITTTYYSDKLSGYITSSTASLSSYWGKLWDVTRTSLLDDLDMTFYIHSSYNNERGFIHLRARRDSSTTDGVTTYSFGCWIKQITGNLTKSRFRLYYNASSGKLQLWCNVNARWGVYNCKVISSTFRTGKELLPITGTLYADSFTTAQTLPTDSYTELTNVREPDYVLVSLHTTNDTEYPLVWSNETNTSNKTSNLLYKSYSDLIYNPKNKRLTVKGSVKTNVLTISSTSLEKHLTFSRGGYNYISAPSGGIIGFMVNGKTDCNSANCELVIQDGNLNPGTTNVTALGTDALRWSNIYAHLANLSASSYSILKLTRSGSTNGALITFANNTGVLGHIGMTGAATNASLNRYTSDAGTSYVIWDSGNDGSGSGLDADKLDGYLGSDYWRNSAEKVWTPATNIRMAPSANGQEWSFDFRDKGSYTGAYWQVWDESKTTLLKVDADTGRVSAPYGFVGAIGDGTMTIKPERNNEVNFGGTHNSATIYFGYRATDSKPIPTQFVFGSPSGTAALVAKSATLSSVVNAGRYYLKYVGTTGTYADLLVNVRGTACTTEGTAGTTGVTYLLLGNGTAVSTTAGSGAENALGILRIYGSSTGYTNIRCGTNNGTGYTMYLPGANGLFVYHTNDTTIGGEHTPVYIAATGAATACTIVDGSGDVDRKLLVTNGSHGIYSTATITGNYQTGALTSTRTTESPVRHTCTNTAGSVSLLVHTNRGLYDSGNEYWMIYSAKDTTNVYIPKWASKGSTTLPVYFNSSGAPALCTAYSGLLTALSSSADTNISITVGGTSKSVTNSYSSYLRVNDIRSTAHLPNASVYPAKYITGWFNNTGTPTTDWYSGINVQGWTKDYATWLLASYASSGNATTTRRDLYFRHGKNDAWGNWKTIIDSENYKSIIGNGSFWKVNDLTYNGTSSSVSTGDIYLEMWRGTAASWKMLNNSGTLKFQCNYTSTAGSYYDAFTIAYNTGNVWIKGTATIVGGVVQSSTGRLTLTAPNTGIDLKFNNENSKSVILNGSAFKPFDSADNNLTLGSTAARWSNVYSYSGNFKDTVHIYADSTGNYTEGIRLYGTAKDSTWSNILFGCDPSATTGTHANLWLIGRDNNNRFVFRNSTTDRLYVLSDGKVGINVVPTLMLHVNGNAMATNLGVNALGGGNGISLYNGVGSVGTYGIAFNQTSNWGTHGYVTSDWATYFTMSNTNNRGWVFRRTSSGNVFSIDTSGLVYANGRINGNYFTSRVATGTQPYACTSTTLNTNLNADLLDGKHLSDLNVDLVYTIDCNSLSDSNFYPIVFSSSTDPLHCRIRSSSRSGSHAWNQNTMEFIYCGSGWSDTPHALTITNYGCYSTSEITIGCIGRGNEGGVVCIWVRGGSAYYLSSNRVGSLKTSNYTSGNEIYTVGTNYYGGANTKVTILFTPLSTISSGNYASGNFKAGNNCYAAHFYENSDIKLKTNIETITSSSNIPQLKSFDWKSDGSHSYGLIALELEEMGYSELVDTSGEHKTVKYSAALSLIVGKLQVKIRELEKEIENLKNKN